MGVTYGLLLALVVLSALLCLWAWRTGGPGQDMSRIQPKPAARHSKALRGEVTTRLRPAAPDSGQLPSIERDGGMAQRLPRREDLPWNQ